MFSKSSKYTIFFTGPILLYLGYTFFQHLNSSTYMSLIDVVDFYIHEFGHILFSIFGNQFLTIAGGTLLQLLIPTLLLVMFLFQGDYFALAFSFAWIGTNLFYVSTYSGDAVEMVLPLVSIGSGEIIHDWFYMFSHLGVIEYTDFISGIFYFMAVIFFLLFFIYSIILIFNRFREGKI